MPWKASGTGYDLRWVFSLIRLEMPLRIMTWLVFLLFHLRTGYDCDKYSLRYALGYPLGMRESSSSMTNWDSHLGSWMMWLWELLVPIKHEMMIEMCIYVWFMACDMCTNEDDYVWWLRMVVCEWLQVSMCCVQEWLYEHECWNAWMLVFEFMRLWWSKMHVWT